MPGYDGFCLTLRNYQSLGLKIHGRYSSNQHVCPGDLNKVAKIQGTEWGYGSDRNFNGLLSDTRKIFKGFLRGDRDERLASQQKVRLFRPGVLHVYGRPGTTTLYCPPAIIHCQFDPRCEMGSERPPMMPSGPSLGMLIFFAVRDRHISSPCT